MHKTLLLKKKLLVYINILTKGEVLEDQLFAEEYSYSIRYIAYIQSVFLHIVIKIE